VEQQVEIIDLQLDSDTDEAASQKDNVMRREHDHVDREYKHVVPMSGSVSRSGDAAAVVHVDAENVEGTNAEKVVKVYCIVAFACVREIMAIIVK